MTTEHDTIKSDDRREYFRLDDEVLLDYARIDETQIAALRERIFDRVVDRFSVAATFATSSRTMSRILSSFSAGQPDLARYLKMMDQKLNQLARLFVIEEMNAGEHSVTQVNLSAGGVVFPSTTEFSPDDMLQLRLALLPAMTGILAIVRVIYCERSAQGNGLPWQVAVEYEHIRESDRDLIASHLMAREAERLRERREQEQEGGSGE
ncbi:MAG TPA: PilZ domain-containing protein [Thiohalobacter sp.]|nr:PilZ domain-containing protein [Thiohalobacter sp.]